MDIPPYEEYLKQIRSNLWVTGTPYGDPRIYFRFYILFIQLLLILISETAFFVSRISSENFLELTQLAPCISIGILTALKTAALVHKRMKIYELTECLRKLYQKKLSVETNRILVRKDLLLVNFLMKYYFILNMVLISVYNFATPILILYYYFAKNEILYKLPFAMLVPFSIDSWVPWTFVYAFSIKCGFICILFLTTVDGLYFVLSSHVYVHFKIISNTIKTLDVTTADHLSSTIQEHQYIFKLGEELENIFTAPNLFNVLVGSLEICALGFNLTTGSWEQIPGCLLFLLSVLLQIFMMCFFGENIIRESKNIGDAAYHCNWYEMDEKSKKTILTIMIRSKTPQQLTAYKFSSISYASFTKIISTSWSYFTILKTVYTPPEVTLSDS